jgi:hypothetical protein
MCNFNYSTIYKLKRKMPHIHFNEWLNILMNFQQILYYNDMSHTPKLHI